MTKNYILTSIGICLLIILSGFIIYLYHDLGLYKNYLSLIIIFLCMIIGICLILYFSKKISLYNIGTFIMILANIILIYNIFEINDKNGYVLNLITNKYEYTTYNLYVQRKNPIYNDISKLRQKKIGILSVNEENTINYINKNISVNIVIYNSIEEISTAISNGEIQGFFVTSEQYENTDFDIKYKVKSIHENKIKFTKTT